MCKMASSKKKRVEEVMDEELEGSDNEDDDLDDEDSDSEDDTPMDEVIIKENGVVGLGGEGFKYVLLFHHQF